MSEHKPPNKKLIRKEAKSLLKKGESRQSAYEQLSEKYKYRKTVAEVLTYLPSSAAKQKYQKWNITLIMLLIVSTAFYLIASRSLGILLWNGLMIYAVAKRLTKYYVWITGLTAFSVIVGALTLLISNNSALNWQIVLSMTALNLPLLILPVWLANNLTPSPTEHKERYLAKDGRQKIRLAYEFPEE